MIRSQFVTILLTQISWSNHLAIMSKVKPQSRNILYNALYQGRIYTFVRGEIKSYGVMVFLKEVSNQYGFQSCLFEELEPNRQIVAEAYKKWLKKELEMAEEDIEKGRVYTIEEVQEHLDKMLQE